MTYPFDQDTDGAGKNTARRLKDRINNATEGHQTVIEKDLVSGETRMLKTKGGMPEITVQKEKKPVLPPGNRTFVFKVFGGTMSAIANRAGSGLARIGAMFATARNSYFVAPWKKVPTVKWNDVIRFEDPDSTPPMDVKVNAEPFSGQLTTLLDYQPTAVPYVHRAGGVYANNPPAAVTQSLLYFGVFETGSMGVRNVLKTGGIGQSVNISRSDIPRKGHSAGLRVKPDGTFIFYGGYLSIEMGGNDLQPYVATSTWSEIKTLPVAPYIYENAHYEQGTHVEEALHAVDLTFPAGYSGAVTRRAYFGPLPTVNVIGPYPVIPGSFAPHDYNELVQHYGQITDREIPAYGYAGSDIEMAFKSKIEIINQASWESHEVGLSRYATYTFTDPQIPHGEITFPCLFDNSFPGPCVVDFSSSTQFELTTKLNPSKKLYECKWSHKAMTHVWPSDASIAVLVDPTTYSTAATAMPPNNAPKFDLLETEAHTVDYMYADIDEEIYITLESSMYHAHQQNYDKDWQDVVWFDEGTYHAKFVVSVRGVETEFPINWKVPPKPDFYGPSSWYVQIGAAGIPVLIDGMPQGGGMSYPDIGRAYLGYMPIPLFNPMWMSQGNCPYIAYTTKAEEAAGVAPEFYLDFPVTLNRWQSLDAPGAFTPFQFLTAYHKHIQMVQGGATGAIYYQSHAWEEWMFVEPIRLQMCNGVKGPWADKIGPEFNGDPQLDISRI